eukprot:GHRR01031051.1.p1 GENE.GHRR01031051.1~~GHRR01031051.1.p1  ORF type:complete len:369 (+),score=113.21 GHRR01031051.1:241-1347(+)
MLRCLMPARHAVRVAFTATSSKCSSQGPLLKVGYLLQSRFGRCSWQCCCSMDAANHAQVQKTPKGRTRAVTAKAALNSTPKNDLPVSSPQSTASKRRKAPAKPKKAQRSASDAPAADQTAAAKAAAAAAAENGNASADGAAEPSASDVANEASEQKKKKRRTAAPKWPPGPLYDSSMRPPNYEGPAHRFISWNVAGMRALVSKDAAVLRELLATEQVDAICLQEHKLQADHVEATVLAAGLSDWHVTFNCSIAKKGYSGTATLCRDKPLNVQVGIGTPEHDDEGRVVAVELSDLWLVNVYVPNSSEGLRRLDYRITQWDKALAEYVKGLHSKGKPVVVCGDLNCAHKEIDIHSPKTNLRSAGFTQVCL